MVGDKGEWEEEEEEEQGEEEGGRPFWVCVDKERPLVL